MKILRRILITLAAPALVILGLSQLGGTPLSRGYATGFLATKDGITPSRHVLSTESGDIVCLVRLKVPTDTVIGSVGLSNGTRLRSYQISNDGAAQWIEISADGQTPVEKFKWPSGVTLVIESTARTELQINDWRIYLTEHEFDSRDRATLRYTLYIISLCLLGFALLGVSIEAYSKISDRPSTYTPELLLRQLVESTEGATPIETKRMQSILSKILLQGIDPVFAMNALNLGSHQSLRIWFMARKQLLSRLKGVVSDMLAYHAKLSG